LTKQILISENLLSSLWEQVGAEKENANIYLYIGMFLKNKGLNNLGEFFFKQHEEETEHSLIICNLIADLGANFEMVEIDGFNSQFGSIIEIAQLFLEREIQTTESLDAIKKLAIDENCPVAEERFRQMLILQQQEYAEATDFMDKAELCIGDWSKVLLWDLSLKED
jgi:ferritin